MATRTATQHFATMDGLRGIAAIVVAVYHRRLWFGGNGEWHGYLAVDFFFLLSGFVIAHAYGARLAGHRVSMRDFVVARLIRLYPMIVLGAVLATIAFLIEGIQSPGTGLVGRTLAALPMALLALPQPFLRQPFHPNDPVWSLFFELIANLAYAALLPRLSTRWIVVITAVLGIALAAAIRAHGQVSFGWLWPTMPLGLLRVGYPFTAGVLLQRLHHAGRLLVPALPVWILGPMLIAVLMVPVLGSWRGEILFTVVAVFVVFPLIVAAASNDRPSPRWTRISGISAALSFPLYLLHVPVFNLADRVPGFASLPVGLRFAIILPLATALSLFAARYYDAPVRAWLSRKLMRRPPAHRPPAAGNVA